MKRPILLLILPFRLFLHSRMVVAQTSTWDGTAWQPSGVAPGSGTGSYTFYVTAGTNCNITGDITGTANMAALYIQGSGVTCTISNSCTATANTVIIQYYTSYPTLTVNGTLNLINLTIGGFLNGAGTVNLSAGTYSQTFDGTHPGGIYPSLTNLNILSGSVNLSYLFDIENLTIAAGAATTISNVSYTPSPSITGTLTLNGSLTNLYAQTGAFNAPIYFTIKNLLINNTGSYNSSTGNTSISNSFIVGGSITPAGSTNSYYYGFDVLGNTNQLTVNGNANLKFSDLTTTNTNFTNVGTLNVSGSSTFTVDKPLNVTTLNVSSGGTFLTSNSPTITTTTISQPITGRLILPGATFTYSPTTLSLNGTN